MCGFAVRAMNLASEPIVGESLSADGSQFDRLLVDGETLPLGAMRIEVIATPGHTSDCVSYLAGDAVFVGDTVFLPDAGSARCDFPGGDPARLFRSVRDRLYALPPATRLFVCHDYAPGGRAPACETTVGAQRRENVHLRGDTDEAAFVRLRRERDASLEVPNLLIPAVQVNLRAGHLPPPEPDGTSYLRVPLNVFGRPK